MKKLNSAKAKVPVHLFLSRLMDEMEPPIDRHELAVKLGYERDNVVSMLKNGSMKIPLEKVSILADAVKIEPIVLMRRVLMEDKPGTWAAIERAMGGEIATKNEVKLLSFIRTRLAGVDIDFGATPEFLESLGLMLDELLDRDVQNETTAQARAKPLRANSVQAKLNAEMQALLNAQAVERQALRSKIAQATSQAA